MTGEAVTAEISRLEGKTHEDCDCPHCMAENLSSMIDNLISVNKCSCPVCTTARAEAEVYKDSLTTMIDLADNLVAVHDEMAGAMLTTTIVAITKRALDSMGRLIESAHEGYDTIHDQATATTLAQVSAALESAGINASLVRIGNDGEIEPLSQPTSPGDMN